MATAHIEIPASDGVDFATVLVDLDTYERLDGRSLSIGSHGYTQMWNRPGVVLLHRWVMGVTPGTGYRVIVDHINRQVLDCRRSNLRIVTAGQSNANRSTADRRTLPVGVRQHREGYQAVIKRNRQAHRLGTFPTPEEAHAAYLAAATTYDRECLALAATLTANAA